MREHDIQCKVCWDKGNMIAIRHYESEQRWYEKNKTRKNKRKCVKCVMTKRTNIICIQNQNIIIITKLASIFASVYPNLMFVVRN